MKRFLTVACICVVTLSIQAQSTDTIARINEIFTHWNNATPGGSVLVSIGDRILYNKAFGLADLEHNVPNTTETIFEAGSVSKQFTAASILLLATEGKLSAQDDVRKYIPELPTYDAPILIQHLLNHTSGLKDWGVIGSLTGWPRTTRVYTQALALEIICKQKSLNFTPGTEYSYSNSNYSLLVTLVERVSGQSLADFTRTRFFEPLGMTHTQWRDNFREIIPNRAIAYTKTFSGYEQLMPFENIHGHGGLLTTAGDLLKWNALLETHAVGGDKLYTLRTQQGILKNGKQIIYAGGLNISTFNNFKEISHSGATAGYRAWLAYYPDKKITIAILSNDSQGNVVIAGRRLAEILFFGEEQKLKSSQLHLAEVSEADIKKFNGIYRSIRDFDVVSINYQGERPSNIRPIHQDTLAHNMYPGKFVYINQNRLLRIFAKDTSSYKRVNPADTTARFIQSFAGKYVSEAADVALTITVKANQLWVNRKPETSFKLIPLYRDGYKSEEFELLEFKRDKKGKIIGFEISLSRAERISFMKVVEAK
jgi:CubicO group peptidase (beta-lactamase class C family)